MTSPTTKRLSAGALLAATLLAVPAAADAAPLKGLQDDPMVLSDNPALRQAFWNDAKAAKVRTVRVLAKWDGSSTAVDAAQLERLRRAATEGRGVGAKLLVGSYVTLGRGKKSGYKVPAKTQTAYVSFMQSVAKGLADIPVSGYLSFNEPNYKTAWPTGSSNARAWVALSNRVYKAIKRVDRDGKVLVGEPSPNVRSSFGSVNPGSFFRTALCLKSNYKPSSNSKSCRTKLLGDGFTIHTYDFSRSPTKAVANKDQWVHGNLKTTVDQIKKLARSGRLSSTAARNIHISEFAYRTEGKFKTSDSRAASYLKAAWKTAKKYKIKSFVWYQLRDPAGTSDWKSGLQTSDGGLRKTWTAFRGLK
ncbi:cellulase family glycosylhydrolase [Patulibacter defluvii]|uniref:cellulase family glycosylhydrolase n=1 Tax=Patulibacter defluvii TaxID=3095358 RepID=UPI002A74A827|nr:cellulase family glycosylhydrolase [Patulibacter sp. DM4]